MYEVFVLCAPGKVLDFIVTKRVGTLSAAVLQLLT